MNRATRLSLALGVAILLGALGLTVSTLSRSQEGKFQGALRNLLPKVDKGHGWQVEYLPVAATIEMEAKVNELLNYDDSVFAVYTRGNSRWSVYIAYWRPGRMSYRLVAGHTPDVCWVGNGWSVEYAQSGVVLANNSSSHLPPAELRTMSLNNQTEYILFWHLLDGEPMSYETHGKPPWYAMFTDLLTRRLKQSPEQFFIRVSGNRPFSEWLNCEVYQQFEAKFPKRAPTR